jgi:16S rRNA G527 N7-methylase RsmG
MNVSELQRCERLIGRTLTTTQETQLESYAAWLAEEALDAGGIGPAEADRVWDRHILDAAAFVAVLPPDPVDDIPIVDIGSGVGLPGIVLAILLPERHIVLVDKSGRRCALQKRATRILEVANCEILQRVIPEQGIPAGVRVFRASLPVQDVLSLHASHPSHTDSVVALTRRSGGVLPQTLTNEAAHLGVEVRLERVGTDILDSPASFLIMSPL